MNMEPFVKAGPAEEMATEGDNWVLCQLKADVAFKATCIIAAAAATRKRRVLWLSARRFPKSTGHLSTLITDTLWNIEFNTSAQEPIQDQVENKIKETSAK